LEKSPEKIRNAEFPTWISCCKQEVHNEFADIDTSMWSIRRFCKMLHKSIDASVSTGIVNRGFFQRLVSG
jgi:hypothetical protein